MSFLTPRFLKSRLHVGNALAVLIVYGLLPLSLPHLKAANSKTPESRLYVSNERSDNLTVIDPATFAVVATIPAGKRPRGIRTSLDGRTIYVALSGSPRMAPGTDPERTRSATADKSADGIGVFDSIQLKRTELLRVGSDPEQFALTLDGTQLVVSNEDTATASVVELSSGKILRQIPVTDEPEGVAVNPVSGEIYVTCEGDGKVFVLDRRGEKIVAQLAIGGRPRSTAFSPDGLEAYIPSETEASLAIVDARAHRVIHRIKIPGDTVLPMGTATSLDGKLLFVTTGRGNQVAVIDVASRSVKTMIAVGQRPWGIVVDPAGEHVYTANGASDDVSVIDVHTLKEVTRIKVGSGPWGLALAPAPGAVSLGSAARAR